MNRLSRQIQRTISHYNNTTGLPPVEKILITGSMSLYLPLLAYLKEELGIDIDVSDPFQNAAHHSATLPPPTNSIQKVLFGPVIGLALSANPYTPNFLYTYRNKNEERKLAKIQKGIMVAGFFALFLLLGLNAAGYIYKAEKKSLLASFNRKYISLEKNALTIEKQIKATDPNVDLSNIRQLTEKINFLNSYLEYSAKRYTPVALFSELFTLTPEGISIHKILYSSPESPFTLVYHKYKNKMEAKQKTEKFTSPFGFFDLKNKEQEAKQEIPTSSKFVLLDGIITTKKQDKNLYLSVYKMILNNSPFFEVVEVKRNSQITPDIGNSLYFTLVLKVTL